MESRKDFLNRPIFVPLPLNTNIGTVKGKKSDKTLNWIIGVFSASIFIWFITNKQFRDFTGLGIFVTFCIYMIVFVTIGCILVSKFVFNIDDKVEQRMAEGSANRTISLSEVCSISAGGVHLEQFTKKLSGLVVNYQGCPALIYCLINRSTDGVSADGVASHEAGLQNMLDLIMKKGYQRLKLNLRYDTENDPIWQYTSDRIFDVADELGPGYVEMMASVINYQFNYTKEHSNISATYYIVKLDYSSTVRDVVTLYSQLKAYSKRTVSSIQLLGYKEFQSVLCDYYGKQHIDIMNILPSTASKDDFGESYILDILKQNGEHEEKNKQEHLDIINGFFDNVYTEAFNLPEEDIADSLEIRDIFEDA